MIHRRRTNKGLSVIEYLIMIMILTTAFFVFKDYLLRGLSGRWKGVGDQFGYGRQFEPTDTIECAYDSDYWNAWYDVTCFENKGCPSRNWSCQNQAINLCQNNYCTLP